eukprot:6899994-Ditylum_brightwellii.AAC.1
MGFEQCVGAQGVWKKDGVIIIVHVDNCLVVANEKEDADRLVEGPTKAFGITNEGEIIEDYLGIKIDYNQDETFRLYQPMLIERIINIRVQPCKVEDFFTRV